MVTLFEQWKKELKAEAIKEFAERLKKKASTKMRYGKCLKIEEIECVEVGDIDNLLEELVDDDKHFGG